MSRLELYRLKSMWGNFHFDYALSMARGFSGGLISLWDPNAFVKENMWCDNNFVIVKGRWIREDIVVFMGNIYAPQSIQDKLALWNKLTDFMANNVGEYIIFGDWNVVRVASERSGTDLSGPHHITVKLRALKVKLREWITQSRKEEKAQLTELVDNINELDCLIDSGLASNNQIDERNSLFQKKEDINKFATLDSLQKARIKWDIEGDENSNHKFDAVNSGVQFNIANPLVTLSPEDNLFLEREFDDVEIKLAVWDCPLCATIFLLFFASGSMPNGANSALFTMIPKVKNPTLVTDFRPISLIGRQILDSQLMLSEIIKWHEKNNRKMLLFKVDFEKAFDLSARTSVLVNGSPTREFPIKRDLRQGDPLSPFLFMIVMEGLHLALNKAKESNFIRGICFGSNALCLSHFIYADDVIIMSEWRTRELGNIIQLLNVFYLVSGLKINVAKSHVYGIGVSPQIVNMVAGYFGCSVGSFPTTYLGIPIGSNMKLVSSWDDLIGKFNNRLASWKARLLSSGGRLTLIKSVLGSVGIYFMSLFVFPVTVINKIEAIIMRFFWGSNNSKRKMAWVKWDNALASYEKGGLNICSLKAFNLALILKWRGRYFNSTNDMWVKVIKAIHGDCFEKVNGSSPWANIVSTCCKLTTDNIIPQNLFYWHVGNGQKNAFWSDPWCGLVLLRDRFNRLYHIDVNKEDKVADKRVNDSWNWSWARENIGSRNLAALDLLTCEFESMLFSDREDYWKCSLDGDGSYTVKNSRNHIDKVTLPSHPIETSWLKTLPKKVNVFL
ncbi:uncharacterized protein [Rutidosis leptorrhynchoides]|uniref:uncharacterized protein n=1 Tax=Rutidosis leptorrhynchoides TaxID=125765 RepID=UPI003A98DC77